MEIVYDRCFGLDVHKSSITACVLFEQKRKPRDIFSDSAEQAHVWLPM